MKLVVVTSPATDAGKTFLATGLTETAASNDYKTIYIDLDKPVGDSLRVFGLRHKGDLPTITTYKKYDLESYARTPVGGYILPKPDNINEVFTVEDASNLINNLKENNFDVAIVDLGASLEAPFWKSFVEQADLVLLVTDCDDKALYRIQELLTKVYAKPPKGYTLLINNREGKQSYYTPHQMYRTLSSYEEISNTFKVPYFKNLEKKTPKTFSPREKFAEDLLRLILSSQLEKDFKFLEEYIPVKEEQEVSQSDAEATEKHQQSVTDDVKIIREKEKTKKFLKVKTVETKIDTQKQYKIKEKSSFLDNIFCKTGYIKDGNFIKVKFENIEELINISQEADAVVMPSSWGFDEVKKYRRSKTTGRYKAPLIVLGGNPQHIIVGADRCVRKINKKTILDITAYSKRLKELWEIASIDSKTGAYASQFLKDWLEEQKKHERIFSVAFFDLDKFKSVNDTYGHDVGDLVLYQFAQFLITNTRAEDFVVRQGGEEFIVVLPDTNAKQGYVLIERLRELWEQKNIVLSDGQILKSTFSAGVAQYKEGEDVVDKADKLMYQAKNTGRNKVLISRDAIIKKIALLGNIPPEQFVARGYPIVTDYKDADCIIIDIKTLSSMPKEILPVLDIYVLGTGKPSDFSIKNTHPNTLLFNSIEKIIANIEGEDEEIIIKPTNHEPKKVEVIETKKTITKEPDIEERTKEEIDKNETKAKVSVLPGARTSKKNLTLPKGGAIFLSCPTRPIVASKMAATIAKSVEKAALICAASESRAALELGIESNVLIEADWRFPGSFAPLYHAGIMVWPIDPYKYSNNVSIYDVHNLVEQIKHKFSLVIVDCAGSLNYCSRISHDEGVIVLQKEGDTHDMPTKQWLNNYASKNVLLMSPIETPSVMEVENGLLITSKIVNCEEEFSWK